MPNKPKISPRAMGKQTPQEALYYIPVEVVQPCPPGQDKWWAQVPPQNKIIVIHRPIDPENHEELIEAIRAQLKRYLHIYKGLYTAQEFKRERLQTISDYLKEYDPLNQYQRSYHTPEQLNLRRYEQALLEVISDEAPAPAPAPTPTTSQHRHPEQSPFTTPKAFETFKYLCDYYPNQKPSRWTYLLNFIIDKEIDTRINESQYWDWLTKHYNFVGAKKKQPNATSRKESGKLKDLRGEYLKRQA